MGKILFLLSKAVGAASLLLAGAAAGSMSMLWTYEPEMPAALMPKEED